MTDQEINEAIAEAWGWTRKEIDAWRDYNEALRQFQCAEIKEDEFYRRYLRVEQIPKAIPDYCNDLNAMHEAWRDGLDEQEQWEFCDELGTIIAREFPESDIYRQQAIETNATARQRAEAFMEIIGKRRES